ncbi:serine/threonine protein kinase [Hyalangium minutum]|uniref:Serine/threonine protein kinase n=1 Tax=Hyalangium minutum TaxID=394096 RepID=A0A085WFZ1_9BACT|nr:serine/threonine-protein kinase [Hyalangium minutum]KFE66604.1 Serine/threonine protein kinase [Hyalangium minutum]
MKRPTTFGKYLLLERINVGGMAEVFIAKAFGVEGFERFLAIKKILPTMAEDQEFITMFIDEARVSVQLNHANIVHIHELGKYEETYYIAMEYVAGRDLRTILERYRRRKEIMPTAQAVFVASKMCEGLDYAHRKKDARGQDLSIIHRDVSPQNILVSYEGDVKVIDFGIAKAANRAQKTQAGILKGKFGYMSPEQVRGMPIDRRSDIFAVGVILYEMLTGEKLFVGESDFSTLEKVRNAEVPLPRQFNPNIPAGLEKVVLKALAREPEDRYQWASDLQEDLMKFLLAGDAIYSGKHLASYMKEAFAEDMLREAEKMERYAAIEKPDQLETSGANAVPTPPPSRSPRKPSMVTPVGPQPPAPATRSSDKLPPPPLVPPPTAEELAEMDGAGDKTQIVDSSIALSGGPSPVLFDDSSTGKNANPLDDSSTGRTENPIVDDTSDTLDGSMQSPFANESTMAAMAAPRPTGQMAAVKAKGKSGSKPQVVIGEGEPENYVGATVIGPAPTSREPKPVQAEEEDGPTDSVPKLTPSRPSKVRPSKREEEEEEERSDARARALEEEPANTGKVPAATKKPPAKQGKAAKPPAAGPGKPINPKIFIIAGAAVLLLGVIGTVVAVAAGSSKGRVMFTVDPPTAKVVLRVDNAPVTPNSVIELEPGPHRVVAAAEGFVPLEQMVNVVESDNPTPVALKLKPENAGSTDEPTNDKPPSEPEKVANGSQDPEQKTPPETPTKDPGTTTPPQPEKPKTFVAVFVGNSGAEIQVDGKSVGQTPNAKAANLAIGKTYRFVAKRAGYKTFTGEFEGDGSSEVKVEFELEKEEPKPPPVEAKPEAKPEPKPQPKPPVAQTPPTPKPAANKMGKFAASTKPAGAQIWVDGKYSGRDTPVAIGNPLMLPLGSRKIVFKLNGKQTKPQAITITESEVAKLINVPVE